MQDSIQKAGCIILRSTILSRKDPKVDVVDSKYPHMRCPLERLHEAQSCPRETPTVSAASRVHPVGGSSHSSQRVTGSSSSDMLLDTRVPKSTGKMWNLLSDIRLVHISLMLRIQPATVRSLTIMTLTNIHVTLTSSTES